VAEKDIRPIATVAIRDRDSQIRLFYLRIGGRKIAMVASAKKGGMWNGKGGCA